ncbi:recombinase, partial [Salmonella enterica]|nr:recombinase [Salmonella enterica]
MDLNKFDAPFNPEDIEWRIQQSGKTRDGKVWAMVLAYVTNRAIMKRLDDVC